MHAQVPYIRHGPNTIPDSVFIMAYLQNTYGKGKTSGILAPMDAAKAAKVESCMALVDQTLPFAVGYYRIIDPQVGLTPNWSQQVHKESSVQAALSHKCTSNVPLCDQPLSICNVMTDMILASATACVINCPSDVSYKA